MAEQHRKELQSDAKYIGMNLFERLQRVGTELPRVAATRSPQSLRIDSAAPTETGISLGLVRGIRPGDPVWLHPGYADPALYASLYTQLAGLDFEAEDRAMRIHQFESEPSTLFVSLRMAPGNYLAARLQPEFFWDPEQLSHDKLSCVLAGTDTVIFCSVDPPVQLVKAFALARAESAVGAFEWQEGGATMRAVYWEIFLHGIGMDRNWTVVLSQPEQELFATTRQFQATLILIVLASIMMALMFSIGHLRRVLQPLQALRTATRQVAEGDLNKQVILASGDEFEELARSFNSMTEKLAMQFDQREALMDIDRLILSSEDSGNVVNEVLVQAQAFPECEYLLFVVQDEHGVRLKAAGNGSNRIEDHQISARKQYAQTLSELGSDEEAVILSQLPGWLPDLSGTGVCTAWLLYPLRVSGVLSGFVLLGTRHSLNAASADAGWALQVVGRLSIALTRVRWQTDLYRRANFDDLTGLPNRSAFKATLSQAIEHSRRHGTRLALLFIDLDRFKLINDSIGHAAGDLYLQVVAERIRGCIRSEDAVSRLGGDEFTVVITDIPADADFAIEVMTVVTRLLEAIPKPVHVGLHELRSTLSIGASVFPDDGQTTDELMKQADTAMYQAKRNGGDSFRFYAHEMQAVAQHRMGLESDIRRALENNQFLLYFQPQINRGSDQVQSAEVLLRWNHPERGFVPPGVFIPIAEESLLIADIDAWVLEATCRQIRQWLDAGIEPVRLAVNISGAQFQNPGFLELIKGTLDRFSLSPDRIELEITEGALIDNLEHARQVLNDLGTFGVRLAIDDFGTGYCSLAYLKSMPIDKLKIDQSFVRDITRSSRDAAIVEVILQLSRQLGLKCIAEGVETRAELDWLFEKGCEVYQGYYFYRPMPLADFAQLLTDQAGMNTVDS
ncbi:EAL domain-containing protein [uncultured Halopseudomonas sp.]|uniref:EAL domain-containing protein n=1 Tax=uncultured Halopseudomonas sp. TaxID=2901193 RepID=UPI0030ED2445